MKTLILTLFASLACIALMAQNNSTNIVSISEEVALEAEVVAKSLVGENGNGNDAAMLHSNGNNSGNNNGNSGRWNYTVRILETGIQVVTLPEQALYNIGEHVAVKKVEHGPGSFPGQGNSDVKIIGHWAN